MKELPEGSLPGNRVAGRGSEGRGPDARSAALGSRSTVSPRPPGPAPRRPQLLPKPATSDWCLPLALVCQVRACEGIERSVTSVTRTPCPVFLLTRGAVLKPPRWQCSMQERSQTPEPRLVTSHCLRPLQSSTEPLGVGSAASRPPVLSGARSRNSRT